MFKYCMNLSPIHDCLQPRPRSAWELLLQTNVSIVNITVACGFLSSCRFSKACREQFGHAPSNERRGRKASAPLQGRPFRPS
jgi:AraC family transcriptional regulator, glycine betaine-responsive activator